jgi:predicted metal-dependent hydrolase
MSTQISLGEMTAEVVLKPIKHVHLSVLPPGGRVRISAPAHMSLETIRLFAIAKLGWIRQQQQKLREQERESPREYLDRESHYVWGKRYLLQVVEAEAAPAVELQHSRIVLRLRPGTDEARRQAVFEEWYREQVRQVVPDLITKWEPLLGVKVQRFFVQRMKTKWGSCTPEAGYIRLNTDLAKKPRECLEYVLVHEMVHLLEPSHGPRFVALMDRYMPNWQFRRKALNSLPLRHEEWGY